MQNFKMHKILLLLNFRTIFIEKNNKNKFLILH